MWVLLDRTMLQAKACRDFDVQHSIWKISSRKVCASAMMHGLSLERRTLSNWTRLIRTLRDWTRLNKDWSEHFGDWTKTCRNTSASGQRPVGILQQLVMVMDRTHVTGKDYWEGTSVTVSMLWISGTAL